MVQRLRRTGPDADFLEHADHEVGRVVDAFEALGELDDTTVLYIVGDNGSSAEGTLTGLLNEMMGLDGNVGDFAQLLPERERWGHPGTAPHYAVGWAWAGDTPFQWTKQIASHFGGTRSGMLVSWPAGIAAHGELRSQLHHVIDVMPTLLEIAGIAEPASIDGVTQKPIEGTSMAYTFASASFDDDVWELYDLRDDFSQGKDLAAQHPDKLRALQDLFMQKAATHNVLPLDDRFIERGDPRLRPSYFYGRDEVVFRPGMTRLPEGSAPKTTNVDHTVTAVVTIPEGGAEGMLICVGGDGGGWSLHVQDVRLYIDEVEVGTGTVPRQNRARFGAGCMDVGEYSLSPVTDGYPADTPHFPFTGAIEHVTLRFSGAGNDISAHEKLEQLLKLD
ncbi:sulfatase-like hydrolase/transferase [Microbacterium sp. LB12]|uniref:sulfatase-like hydrolase/transferase n=1 Tax=Microbacterium sp. LB12 TaxID=3081270 RepID=UPI0030197332